MKKQKLNIKIEKKLLKQLPEFDNHFLVVHLVDKRAKLDSYIAIHRRNGSLPSFGATRMWKYSSNKEALKDVLRLSKLMSYKSVLADLPYGGAKAVIIEPKTKFSREKLFEAYAKGLNELKGKFITGTDVGLNISDLEYMKKFTPYLVGYLSNPENATALGLIKSLDTLLNHVYNNKSYSKYSFAIQGVGKVGFEFLKMIIKGGAKNIYIADIDKNKIKKIISQYPFIKVVNPNKIHSQQVDIYCPCALSGSLNNKMLNELKCKIIIGSANNQLENSLISDKLFNKRIVYCPDYIVNSGGLISVVDEYRYHKSNKKRLVNNINKIGIVLKKILISSKKKKLSPFLVSEEIGLLRINKNYSI